MAFCSFEEQYALFDMTPVDNQFILEYLPAAKGDDVRVYLYGLMLCLHPQEDSSVEQMARELHMSEEDVLGALRRWERKGLVQRISDHPVRVRYVSVKRHLLMGGQTQTDQDYEEFAEALHSAFGNDYHISGQNIAMYYEWVEERKLSTEVVIRLIEHMIVLHGKGFSAKAAQKLLTMLADEKCTTAQEADQILARDRAVWEGARTVLRRLGKRRNPSEDEQGLYRKWLMDWAFEAEAILSACAETTKGEPTFAYLDGILRRHHQASQGEKITGRQMEKRMQAEKDAAAPLKALLEVLGLSSQLINDGTLAVYGEMRELYPDGIILLAGRECARRGLNLEGVMKTLQAWKHQGLETAEDIQQDLRTVNEHNAFLQSLYTLWGTDARPNAADRRLLRVWREQWGYEESFIVACAAWASKAEKPVLYLNHMLGRFHEKGIRTVEAAAAEREAWHKQQDKPRTKVVGEQQYTQREYTHNEDAVDRMMSDWTEDKTNA